MKKTVGKVTQVYIPNQYKNGNLLDIMDRTNIGFKVLIDNEIRDIVVEQNEFNSNIFKDDKVLIIEQVISGKNFIDIELIGEEDYE